jgi:hypothetical protein
MIPVHGPLSNWLHTRNHGNPIRTVMAHEQF